MLYPLDAAAADRYADDQGTQRGHREKPRREPDESHHHGIPATAEYRAKGAGGIDQMKRDERMPEVLDDADWDIFEKINGAVVDEIEDFLRAAGKPVTPDAQALFQLGVILGITRTLQWLKYRKQRKQIKKAPG